MSDDNHNRFLIKLLGFTMQSMNLNPERFIKLFWHIAFMIAFVMAVAFVIAFLKFKLGMA